MATSSISEGSATDSKAWYPFSQHLPSHITKKDKMRKYENDLIAESKINLKCNASYRIVNLTLVKY
jgi:hypothetical protein